MNSIHTAMKKMYLSNPFHYNEATKSAALINGRPNSKDESLSREGDFR